MSKREGDDQPAIPLLISFRHCWSGAVVATCALCDATVYEQAENLRVVATAHGVVICIRCALRLKRELPEMEMVGQLWEGMIREPEPSDALMTLVLAALNSKPKGT